MRYHPARPPCFDVLVTRHVFSQSEAKSNPADSSRPAASDSGQSVLQLACRGGSCFDMGEDRVDGLGISLRDLLIVLPADRRRPDREVLVPGEPPEIRACGKNCWVLVKVGE